jgi:hypothetical protein
METERQRKLIDDRKDVLSKEIKEIHNLYKIEEIRVHILNEAYKYNELREVIDKMSKLDIKF